MVFLIVKDEYGFLLKNNFKFNNKLCKKKKQTLISIS